jgi:hypothetical protein
MLSLAQLQWSNPSGNQAWTWMAIAFVIGLIAVFSLTFVPTQFRKYVVGFFTFIAGAFYFLLLFWPSPVLRQPFQKPNGFVESGAFLLEDLVPIFSSIGTVVPAFLLGLGVWSLLRVHLSRISKRQKDWSYSVVLLTSMVVMAVVGYADWRVQTFSTDGKDYSVVENWTIWQKSFDFLFNGTLQVMDAAMFSIIAFFILSAAYRAFRIRSVEASIMLSVALIMMLNVMGALQVLSFNLLSEQSPIVQNLMLANVAAWIKDNVQVPSLRAMEFGIAIGAFAMAVRLWLGLERSGV